MPKKPALKAAPKKIASIPSSTAPRQLPIVATKLSEMTLPTHAEEARLIEAARRIEELKPWQVLDETNLFVVENPETGERGFVSVLGAGGTNFSVLVYRGDGSFFQLQDFLSSADEDDASPFDLLKISQLQLAFDSKIALEPHSKDWLKRHKIPLRGRSLFPTFSSLCVGYLPWRVDGAEARFLAVALEQLIELFTRPGFSPDLFVIKTAVKGGQRIPSFFARRPSHDSDAPETLIWRDERLAIEPPPPYAIELPDCDAMLEKIAAKPRIDAVWELDFDMMPMPIAAPNQRPYFPEIVMLGGDGLILSQDTTHQSYWAGCLVEMTKIVIGLLAKQPKRPRELWFSDVRLLSVMQMIREDTPIEVKPQEQLPSLDAAFDGLFGFMDTSMPDIEDLNPFAGLSLDDSVLFGPPSIKPPKPKGH